MELDIYMMQYSWFLKLRQRWLVLPELLCCLCFPSCAFATLTQCQVNSLVDPNADPTSKNWDGNLLLPSFNIS